MLKGIGGGAAAAAALPAGQRLGARAALDANRLRSAYTGLTFTVAGGFLVVVAWIGGRQALDGDITIGELIAALGLTQFLLGPLGRLALTGEVLAQARVGLRAHRRRPRRTARGHRRRRRDRRRPAGGLTVRDLRHGSLAGLDLDIAAGEIVGVVAATPADAAALIACLDRTVAPDAGTVAVDGRDHAGLDLAARPEGRDRRPPRRSPVRGHAGGRAGHHGRHARPRRRRHRRGPRTRSPRRCATWRRRRDGMATATGRRAPPGRRAHLGEAGRGLSGGQRQRVALARALATDAPVLVLHEPTTAVDAATEHRIAAGIRSVRAGRTTVVVTTSPTLLAAADRVVLVDGGRVVADGDHATLAAGDERYRTAVLA